MNKGNRSDLLSYLAIFSIAFGCIIGWGSFVSPAITFIPQAGVVGVLIGIFVASFIALLICVNYIGLARYLPEAKGSYELIKTVFGKDQAFFSAWALLMAYLCIFWSNVSASSYLGRSLFGDGALYSVHYTFMGYDVYPGDIIISAIVLLAGAVIVCRGYDSTLKVLSAIAVILLLLITVMFIAVVAKGDPKVIFSPAFESANTLSRGVQIAAISLMAPWVFVGFESVSHAANVKKVRLNRGFITGGISIIAAMAVFLMLTVIINSALPAGFRSWKDYSVLSDGFFSFDEIPAMYGVINAMGDAGRVILSIAFSLAILGSILAFLMASSRVIKIMADDGLTPKPLLAENKNGIPYNAVHLILAFSIPFLFVGLNMLKSAINISTLLICMVYGFISVGAAIHSGRKIAFRISGIIGAVLSFGIFIAILIPNEGSGASLTKDDYLILSVWCLAGLICYRLVLYLDKDLSLGRSMLMWLLMFFLLFYSTNMWTHEVMETELLENTDPTEIHAILLTNNLARTVVIIIALLILFELFTIMLKREKDLNAKISSVEENYNIKNTLLANTSHDIRTPLNAIIGFADLALQDNVDSKRVLDYMKKIRLSGVQLLSLIDDMLVLNRLENGKLSLREEAINLPEYLMHLHEALQIGEDNPNVDIIIDVHTMENDTVICDRSLLKHLLTFFASNAVKNSREGGKVTLGVMQLGAAEAGLAMYEFFVKDSGDGFLPDGMGFTAAKRIIDVMGGRMEIEPTPGVGTEVYITLELAVRLCPFLQ